MAVLTDLDLEKSKEARDEALERVAAAMLEAWYDKAAAVVEHLAKAGVPFTSDDVWETGLPKPKEPRALGVVFKRAHDSGLIVPTGQWQLTSQTLRHAAPIRVWKGV